MPMAGPGRQSNDGESVGWYRRENGGSLRVGTIYHMRWDKNETLIIFTDSGQNTET